MNDETYTYIATQRERKSLKNSARYRKNGSKSKRCSLPHDGLTAKQLRERNGEIMSYNLGGKMSYADFKRMPDDLKKEYLTKLTKEHEGRAMDIAEMFGIRKNTFSRVTTELGFDMNAKPKRIKLSPKWIAFINGAEKPSDEQELEEVSAPTEASKASQEEISAVKQVSEEAEATNGQLFFTGSPEAIFAKVMQILNPTEKYSMTIGFFISEET